VGAKGLAGVLGAAAGAKGLAGVLAVAVEIRRCRDASSQSHSHRLQRFIFGPANADLLEIDVFSGKEYGGC
jgi:hypothetical protein